MGKWKRPRRHADSKTHNDAGLVDRHDHLAGHNKEMRVCRGVGDALSVFIRWMDEWLGGNVTRHETKIRVSEQPHFEQPHDDGSHPTASRAVSPSNRTRSSLCFLSPGSHLFTSSPLIPNTASRRPAAGCWLLAALGVCVFAKSDILPGRRAVMAESSATGVRPQIVITALQS
ncbi:uncharacterized protein SPSK_09925 [Sporothrix schenckii 1099-18]|uniref:Uncharacterized protein n=1 Tax=Sporothrix schenckii 1099-18 TaxID=1397361 RepID=A0A0F2M9U3_SPOSC|nr:uncharacterized protein SPSK_09925 [Sporothrix schenckii 1099-18]KJR85864.1 hypothetical protein SPSK_09925 [Sporothrix schenckii 1099-18]